MPFDETDCSCPMYFQHLSAFLILGEPRKLINQTKKFAGETITGTVKTIPEAPGFSLAQ